VVDVLRSATVAAAVVRAGSAAVTLTPSVRAARQVAEREGAVLVGERAGVPIEGFNHGSSPSVLRGIALSGRSVVLLSDEAPAGCSPATASSCSRG
jgi:2-phosphosulfolactate phosphatase